MAKVGSGGVGLAVGLVALLLEDWLCGCKVVADLDELTGEVGGETNDLWSRVFPLSSFPRLPAEIISHIIQLSLPPLSYFTFGERKSTLLACTLVCSEWKQLGQAERYRHILIESLSQLGSFCRVSAGRADLGAKYEAFASSASRPQRL